MSRCWVMEVGGDRCVLTEGHPGSHMGGYHTFTHVLPAEEMARVLGAFFDQMEHALRSDIKRLRADLARVSAVMDEYGVRDMSAEKASGLYEAVRRALTGEGG